MRWTTDVEVSGGEPAGISRRQQRNLNRPPFPFPPPRESPGGGFPPMPPNAGGSPHKGASKPWSA